MFTPQTYSTALFLMTLSMLCWGTWANTQKITRQWPFELYYFDYTLGLLVCSADLRPHPGANGSGIAAELLP